MVEGVTHVRFGVTSRRGQTPEMFDWSVYDARFGQYTNAGLDLVVTLVDYPEWASRYRCGGGLLPGMEAEWRSFVRAAVVRYGKAPYRVAAWEIGNEVDAETAVRPDDFDRSDDWGRGEPTVPHGGCFGDVPEQYVTMLRAAYEEIKSVDPDATVVIAGLAIADLAEFVGYDMFKLDFLDRILDAGGGAYFDVMNYHWFPDVPNQMTGTEKHLWVRARLRRHGIDVPIWLTETYRLTTPTDPASPYGQVRFLTQELVEVLAFEDLERVYWYGWVDFPPELKPSATADDRGLVRHDLSPRPALAVLPYVVAYTNGRPEDLSSGAVTAYRFQAAGAREAHVVAWSRSGTTRLRLETAEGGAARTTYFPPDMLLDGQCCGHAEVRSRDGVVELDVGPEPVFVSIGRAPTR